MIIWLSYAYIYVLYYYMKYTDWLYTYPSEKYEFVSLDDYFPYMETKFMFQTK